ncbi:MAG: ABC transporter permease subunit/CPBP intramembrane protease [Planctomycetota bacterium]|jgi:sodium transport system permease protein
MIGSYFANGRLLRLCLKELRESLRDRRTLITLVLMPILVYPLLSMAMQRLIVGTASGTSDRSEYIIGVANEDAGGVLASAIAETSMAIEQGVRHSIQIRRNNQSLAKQPATIPDAIAGASEKDSADESNQTLGGSKAQFNIVVTDGITLQSALESGQIDLAVISARAESVAVRGNGFYPAYEFEVEFRDADVRSENAMLEFRKAMELVNDSQALRFRGPLPVSVRMVSTATGKKVDAMASLAGILPLILILMTITGAVYPAIDLTAGERERGTMEAMIATPAPRFLLLLSKYVAVVTVAVLTALANLFASWITLSIGGLGRALLGEKGFSLLALVQILPLLVIFAAFFSAILLAMCSFARSFKEAQAYLIPVMLVSLAPALVTLMPNIEFSTLLGIVPLVNILLLSRDIMTGSPQALPAFAAVFSTLLYAAAALVVASKLFGAESATSGSQETWSDLLRRPKRTQLLPDLGDLAVFLAMLFPVFFIVTNLFGQTQMSIGAKLWSNAGMLLVLFFVTPSIVAWYRRLNPQTTFLLRSWTGNLPQVRQRVVRGVGVLLSVCFMAAGLWIVAFEFLQLLKDYGFGLLALEQPEVLEKAKKEFAQIPFWIILVTSAIVPAFAEEYFFRGYVLSAFRNRVSSLRAILYSALIFGLFHVITGSMLSLERFFPSTLLGLFLGFVAIRTGSLWPGVLLHAIHNGLVFWLTRFSTKELSDWFGSTNEHFPPIWIFASLASVTLGSALLYFITQRRFYENAT